MTLYARNDHGIIRCAECDARFGEVRDGTVYIDVGWVEAPGRVIAVTTYNRARYDDYAANHRLREWRARVRTDNRNDASKHRPKPTIAELFNTPLIECPGHGTQVLDREVLGVNEWFAWASHLCRDPEKWGKKTTASG